ncbi:hypothetical protein P4S68_13640 [Pseudoalteromonas sp. Hal099]
MLLVAVLWTVARTKEYSPEQLAALKSKRTTYNKQSDLILTLIKVPLFLWYWV